MFFIPVFFKWENLRYNEIKEVSQGYTRTSGLNCFHVNSFAPIWDTFEIGESLQCI